MFLWAKDTVIYLKNINIQDIVYALIYKLFDKSK